MTSVLPRTSMATRSSAASDPDALANGATPVVRRTLNGPSIRTFSKPVMPKLRVAAPAGAANASANAAAERRKVRMSAPSYSMFKVPLRAADVSGPGLADVALGAAGHVDISGTHDADVGGSARVRFDAARSCDRDLGLLSLDCARVDIARPGSLIFGRLRLASAGLHAARPGDRELQRLHLQRRDSEPA